MYIPGFTAEASLYKTSQRCNAAPEGAHASGSVYPAQLLVPRPQDWSVYVDENPLGLYCSKLRCYPVPYHPYLECRRVIERC
jgi:hypothetical protein